MRYQLTVIRQSGLSVYPIDKERIIIGRSSKADLRIKERFVSRKQLVIERTNSHYTLVGLGGKNQLLLNGDAIKSNHSYPLREGDKIKLGEVILAFTERQAGNDSAISEPVKEPECMASYNISPQVAGNIAALTVSTSSLPLNVGGEIKRLIRKSFAKGSYWMISLVAHMVLLGLLVFFYLPKQGPDIDDNAFAVTFGNAVDGGLRGDFNPDSLLQDITSDIKTADILQGQNDQANETSETDEPKFSDSRIAEFLSLLPGESDISNGQGDRGQGNGTAGSGYKSEPMPPRIGLGGGSGGLKNSVKAGKVKTKSETSGALLTGNRSGTPGAKILTLKWEYKFFQTNGVVLNQPSGWGHGDASVLSAPWLISSPAIVPDKNSINIVSGTEEGSGEFNPANSNTRSSGRYICVDSKGHHKWEYQTENNAGRASPVVFNYGNSLEILGGSTSGWMVHLFKNNGQRIWRFESESKSNFISSPVVYDVDLDSPGPEIFAVDLNGALYCLAHNGKKIWSVQVSQHPAITTPVVYDVDKDGNMEIIAVGTKVEPSGAYSIVHCLDAKTGEVKWIREVHHETNTSGWYFQASSPAIIPDADSPKITVGIGNELYAFSGKTGKITWYAATGGYIYSSPAIGDCDGDKMPEVVFGSLDGKVYCVDGAEGKIKWSYKTKGQVYSSPALVGKSRVEPYQAEWSMFRGNSQRTGCYQNSSSSGLAPNPNPDVIGMSALGLDIVIGSNDGALYLLDGKDGHCIDGFSVKFPNLTVANSNQGPLKFISSPIVADIDGDRKLEIIFTLVDRMVCVTDNRK